MKLSTGKVAFPIEFDNGETEVIYFNPNDPDLAVRMKDFETLINKRVEELGNISVGTDGTPTDRDAENIEAVRQIQQVMYEEIDRAFNSKISDKVFKYCSPFAVVDGNYFILAFIEGIMPEIEKSVAKANAKVESQMDKYLSKYGK